MIKKIKFHSKVIPYTVIKTNRRKTSQISVDEDNVIVRIPKSKSSNEIKHMVTQRARWIYEKQEEFRKNKSSFVKLTYTDGSTLPYIGKNRILRVKTNQKKTSIEFRNSKFTVLLEGKRPIKKTIQKLFNQWVYNKSKIYFDNRIAVLTSKTRIKPTKIEVKSLKGRWGSASKDGRISLNSNLLKVPKDVIDYIIIHELCHLKIKDHSFRYWNLIRKFMPDYEEKKNWLEIHSKNIL